MIARSCLSKSSHGEENINMYVYLCVLGFACMYVCTFRSNRLRLMSITLYSLFCFDSSAINSVMYILHKQEIPENAVDVIHLHQVHSPCIAAGIDLRRMWNWLWSFARHKFSAVWEAMPAPDEHIGRLSLKHRLVLFGVHVPLMDIVVDVQQVTNYLYL